MYLAANASHAYVYVLNKVMHRICGQVEHAGVRANNPTNVCAKTFSAHLAVLIEQSNLNRTSQTTETNQCAAESHKLATRWSMPSRLAGTKTW